MTRPTSWKTTWKNEGQTEGWCIDKPKHSASQHSNISLKFGLKPASHWSFSPHTERSKASRLFRLRKGHQLICCGPIFRANSSRSCPSVVWLSFFKCSCASQTRHQQGLDQCRGHLGVCAWVRVCVFSLRAGCSPIHGVGAEATWLRTGGTVVSHLPPSTPLTETWKRKRTSGCTLRTCTTSLELCTYKCKLSNTHRCYNLFWCRWMLILLRTILFDSIFTQCP